MALFLGAVGSLSLNTPEQHLTSERASLMTADELAKTVDAELDQGLTAPEAARRLAEQGANEWQSAAPRPAWRRLLGWAFRCLFVSLRSLPFHNLHSILIWHRSLAHVPAFK